jgi:hypothetical protein
LSLFTVQTGRRVRLGRRVTPGQKDQQGRPGHKATRDRKDLKEISARKDQQGLLETVSVTAI